MTESLDINIDRLAPATDLCYFCHMFRHLGYFAFRHRWLIIALWAIALTASAPIVPRLGSVLKLGGFASDNLEALRASQALERSLGHYSNNVIVVFRSDDLTAADPAFRAAVDRVLNPLRALPGVAQVISPQDNPRQLSRNGHTAFALIALQAAPERSRSLLREVQSYLHDDSLDVLLSGVPVFYSDIEDVSERDLRRAEMVALPLGLLALILVLRSLVAAVVTIAVGGAGVAVAMATLFGLGHSFDLSIFVLNMATMLGLGLSIDYALFLTYRFREEAARLPLPDALASTVATAGRAVFFSALTVLTGLLGLTTFDAMMLRSLGLGGIIVVAAAALSALTLLPALLATLGPRVNTLALPLPGRIGFSWARLASMVMRRPFTVLLPVLALLVALGSPFLGVRLSSPDATILPRDMPSRLGFEVLRQEFGEGEVAPIEIVVRGRDSIVSPTNLASLYDFTHRLANDPRVERVDSIVDLDPRITKEQYQLLYQDPGSVSDPFARAALAAFARDDTTWLRVISRHPLISPEAQSLVRDIRRDGIATGFDILVGGSSATIVDHVANLYSELPRAIAIVVVVTYLALFLLFRSVILPLKAIAMNSLSLLASYGALVVVFQNGFLSGFLGFEPTGFIEASLPIVMFCFLFGVSMDYEVFLLTRIKEAYDSSGDNTASVAEGLERSGRIITGAALVVVVVAASFVAADIVLIKALGLGTAVAVLLDATVVRALLAPATMRLLGKLNWWLPNLAIPDWRNVPLPRSTIGRAGTLAVLAVLVIVPAATWSGLNAAPDRPTTTPRASTSDTDSSLTQPAPRPITFPDDDAAHDNLTEWWYYTGHLKTRDAAAYGFEFVVFQSLRKLAPAGYAAHFAVSDQSRGLFRFDQRSSATPQLIAKDGFDLDLNDWRIAGNNGQDVLTANMDGYALRLGLRATKPPVLHGGKGLVSFGPAGDSYYYSRTRMAADGVINVDGVARSVSGTAWMDHQWGDFLVLNQGGWDWFGLQLSDGSDLTVSRVRDASGRSLLLYGTYVDPAGNATHIPDAGLRVSEKGFWTSPRSGSRYPAGWALTLASPSLTLDVTPLIADQELDTRKTSGVIYWEGESSVAGHLNGQPITGLGYVELTGYASAPGR